MEYVMLKNNEFKIVSNISEMVRSKSIRRKDIRKNLITNDMIFFKYTPITSFNVIRRFSSHTVLLIGRRRYFLFEHIRHISSLLYNGIMEGMKNISILF